MKKANTFLFRGLLFLAALLICTTANSRNLVDLIHAPPVATPEAAAAGNPFERLADAYYDRSSEADKGFFPRLGNYFDPATAGWGLDIQAIGNTIFAVWFTYLANGDPFWYIIVGDLETKGGGGSITGSIDQFKWDPVGAAGDQADNTVVGQMTITWTSETEAEVSWTLDGQPGSAEIEFIQFSADPTLTDMTGHYFIFLADGWGFTLLTQGQVTVLTMYWYKNGQPVWAQGVAAEWGKNPLIELLYFNGPGLCPACLPRKGGPGGGPPSTTSLASLQVNYGVEVPPLANLSWTDLFGKGGPLGSNPFDDIPLGFSPITAQGITSSFGDNFDEDYGWFINAKGNGAVRRYERTRNVIFNPPGSPPSLFIFPPFVLPPPFADVLADPSTGAVLTIPYPTSKGAGCIPFEFDNGNLGFPTTRSGIFETGYLLLPPTNEGTLLVYTNPGCTTPLTRLTGGGPAPSRILMGPAGDGHLSRWSASISGKGPYDKGFDDEGDD